MTHPMCCAKIVSTAGAIGIAAMVLVGGRAFAQSSTDQLPTRLGSCGYSVITELGTRLEGVPDSGSSVSFSNGGYQVSYGEVPAVSEAKIGDRVIMCLAKLPHDCPPHDNRGKLYITVDLRTLSAWALPDSEHECGGA